MRIGSSCNLACCLLMPYAHLQRTLSYHSLLWEVRTAHPISAEGVFTKLRQRGRLEPRVSAQPQHMLGLRRHVSVSRESKRIKVHVPDSRNVDCCVCVSILCFDMVVLTQPCFSRFLCLPLVCSVSVAHSLSRGSRCSASGKTHIGCKVLSHYVYVWSLISQQPGKV